jgi:hypothetical protein
MPLANNSVRLIVEAICADCGPLLNMETNGLFAVVLAQAHTATTGHAVVLNGTSDVQKQDEEEEFLRES